MLMMILFGGRLILSVETSLSSCSRPVWGSLARVTILVGLVLVD
jgi:hypothetical protein